MSSSLWYVFCIILPTSVSINGDDIIMDMKNILMFYFSPIRTQIFLTTAWWRCQALYASQVNVFIPANNQMHSIMHFITLLL